MKWHKFVSVIVIILVASFIIYVAWEVMAPTSEGIRCDPVGCITHPPGYWCVNPTPEVCYRLATSEAAARTAQAFWWPFGH